jgi:hypothetical protein
MEKTETYGVVSVSTIGFVTVLAVWSLFLPLGWKSVLWGGSVALVGLRIVIKRGEPDLSLLIVARLKLVTMLYLCY